VGAGDIVTVISIRKQIEPGWAINTIIFVYWHAFLLIKLQTKNVHHNALIVNSKIRTN